MKHMMSTKDVEKSHNKKHKMEAIKKAIGKAKK